MIIAVNFQFKQVTCKVFNGIKLSTQPGAPMQKGGQAPFILSKQWKKREGNEGGGGGGGGDNLEDMHPCKTMYTVNAI